MTAEKKTELNGRKIVFPDVTTFAELFPTHEPFKSPAKTLLTLPSWEAGTWSDRSRRTTFKVSDYCSIDGPKGYSGLHVTTTQAVLDWIENNMLPCSNDTTHFEVRFWDDGRALVSISHGVIIGSHYLAVIDSASVPQ